VWKTLPKLVSVHEWVVRVQKNEYKKDLGSLHVSIWKLSEENKRLHGVDAIWWDNNTFFQIRSCQNTNRDVHSLARLFNGTIIRKYCSKNYITLPHISTPKTQIEESGPEILKPLRNKAEHLYMRQSSSKIVNAAVRACLSICSWNPSQGICIQYKKSWKPWLGSYYSITIRHYFMLSGGTKKKILALERRIDLSGR